MTRKTIKKNITNKNVFVNKPLNVYICIHIQEINNYYIISIVSRFEQEIFNSHNRMIGVELDD